MLAGRGLDDGLVVDGFGGRVTAGAEEAVPAGFRWWRGGFPDRLGGRFAAAASEERHCDCVVVGGREGMGERVARTSWWKAWIGLGIVVVESDGVDACEVEALGCWISRK